MRNPDSQVASATLLRHLPALAIVWALTIAAGSIWALFDAMWLRAYHRPFDQDTTNTITGGIFALGVAGVIAILGPRYPRLWLICLLFFVTTMVVGAITAMLLLATLVYGR